LGVIFQTFFYGDRPSGEKSASICRTFETFLLSSTRTLDMKEPAHAIVRERAGTAVVLLVGVRVGLTARRVRRERRGPD
jgi:hypothetical protein